MRVGAGAKRIRECLTEYLSALKNEYSSGLILPKKGMDNGTVISTSAKPVSNNSKANMAETEKKMGNVSITSSAGVRIEVTIFIMNKEGIRPPPPIFLWGGCCYLWGRWIV